MAESGSACEAEGFSVCETERLSACEAKWLSACDAEKVSRFTHKIAGTSRRECPFNADLKSADIIAM